LELAILGQIDRALGKGYTCTSFRPSSRSRASIDNHPKDLDMIPYGRQDITDEDMAAVISCLRSDFLTQGPAVSRFEQTLVDSTGAAFAVAMNSATSALHVACMALDLQPGDRYWTSPNTFVATANCARYCGATVDFVDIDPLTYNMSVTALTQKLEAAARKGALPKIVSPVHMTGQSCDMAAIGELARRYGFRVIEDASHAIGGAYRGKPVGDCAYSDVTVFSFHPVKIVTTAEGGAAMTNDPALAQRMGMLRTHGITRDPQLMTHVPDGPWYYQQLELGYNYRMTDLQAALGASQMSRLQTYVQRRHKIAERYDQAFANLPLMTPWQHPESYSAYHLYVIRLRLDEIERSHREVFEALRTAGLGVNLHYIPVHLQPYYRNLGFEPGDFPEAERYYQEAISLPMYPTMTDETIETVIAIVGNALGSA
jgi:UDP-4-amino-4,6-dideoxy-N-acetyl-beta-L-altrosamine transaminase